LPGLFLVRSADNFLADNVSALASLPYRRSSVLVRRQSKHVQQLATVFGVQRACRDRDPGPVDLICRDSRGLASALRRHSPRSLLGNRLILLLQELAYV
jgi:hypothetical protein